MLLRRHKSSLQFQSYQQLNINFLYLIKYLLPQMKKKFELYIEPQQLEFSQFQATLDLNFHLKLQPQQKQPLRTKSQLINIYILYFIYKLNLYYLNKYILFYYLIIIKYSFLSHYFQDKNIFNFTRIYLLSFSFFKAIRFPTTTASRLLPSSTKVELLLNTRLINNNSPHLLKKG